MEIVAYSLVTINQSVSEKMGREEGFVLGNPIETPICTTVTFAGGKKVEAEHAGYRIRSDQPKDEGGEGSAPSPFDYFISSMAICAGYYVSDFCRARDLSDEGIRLEQVVIRDPETKGLAQVEQTIHLPARFPEKYAKALVRAAGLCSVKKSVLSDPEFSIRSVVEE